MDKRSRYGVSVFGVAENGLAVKNWYDMAGNCQPSRSCCGHTGLGEVRSVLERRLRLVVIRQGVET